MNNMGNIPNQLLLNNLPYNNVNDMGMSNFLLPNLPNLNLNFEDLYNVNMQFNPNMPAHGVTVILIFNRFEL